MKKLLLLLIFGASLYNLRAQCGLPQSSIDLHGNNIQARIQNGGDLFTDFANGQFSPNPNPDWTKNASTIFTAGLWMGGVDPGGNLKMAAIDYRSGTHGDYSAGPLSEDGLTDAFTCANWDRHFLVRGAEVAAFLAALPMTQAEAIAQFPSIMGWPGRGNSSFSSIYGFDLPLTTSPLAPFYDANGDGFYTPLSGDYPVVELRGIAPFVPTEMVWCVFNDQKGGGPHTTTSSQPIRVEIQLTAWAFSCPDNPVLNNTVFTSHQIINHSTEPLSAFHVGYWVDFDLGCYTDDYVGCNPERNTMFAYNTDAVDGSVGTNCNNGDITFGNAPPVQTVTFLGNTAFEEFSLDKFIAYNDMGIQASGDPTQAIEYYRNLTGVWRDGTALTYGGTGYGGVTPTDHAFSGDPDDPNGWSMCTVGTPLGDRRVLGSHNLDLFEPGGVEQLTVAWTVHENIPQPCNLGNALQNVDNIRALHNSGYTNVCAPFLKAPELPAESLEIFPNPTSGDATLRYGDIKMEEMQVFDATGKLVQSATKLPQGTMTLKMGQLPAGVYSVRLFSAQGVVVKPLAVVR